MNVCAYSAIEDYRKKIKALTDKYEALFPAMTSLAAIAAEKDTPPYPHETAVVYNTAWDGITADDEIKIIVVGDNPGKEEQLAKNRSYLVGQSGRVAEGFFRRNAELAVDFRKNCLITNKTPLHTAKTKHLKLFASGGEPELAAALTESQRIMAEATAELHKTLFAECGTQLWLVGYAELKERGVFTVYRDALKACYTDGSRMIPAWSGVKVYQHFSMNRFLIDLKSSRSEGEELAAALCRLGDVHKSEIFGL